MKNDKILLCALLLSVILVSARTQGCLELKLRENNKKYEKEANEIRTLLSHEVETYLEEHRDLYGYDYYEVEYTIFFSKESTERGKADIEVMLEGEINEAELLRFGENFFAWSVGLAEGNTAVLTEVSNIVVNIKGEDSLRYVSP